MKLILALLATLGYFKLVSHKKLSAYVIWTISNTGWSIYNFSIKEWEMAAMFIIYDLFCIYGILNCRLNNLVNKCQKKF